MAKGVKAKTAATGGKKTQDKKRYNNREVVPVIYNGFAVNHGSYVAAKYVDDGMLVFSADDSDRPLPYSQI